MQTVMAISPHSTPQMTAASPTRELLKRAGAGLVGMPGTCGYLALLAVLAGLANLPAGAPLATAREVATRPLGELPGSPVTAVASLGWAASPAAYLVVVVALVVWGRLGERRLGLFRWLGLLVIGQVATLWLALAVAALARPVLPDWSVTVESARVGGPSLGALVVGMAATSRLTPLWRRRIRLGTLAGLGTMALFDGRGLSLPLGIAALLGLLAGRLLRSAPSPAAPGGAAHPGRLRNPLGSIHEARVLVATLVAALGVGSMLSSLLGYGTGPFAPLGLFAIPVRREVLTDWDGSCPADLTPRDCALVDLLADPHPGTVLLSWLPAVLFLVLAIGLRRGRRLAWQLTLLSLLGVGALAVLVFAVPMWGATRDVVVDSEGGGGSDLWAAVLPSLAPLVGAAVLWSARGLFPVRLPHEVTRRLLGTTLAALSGGFAAYLALGLLTGDGWLPVATPAGLVHDAPLRLLPAEWLFGDVATHLPVAPLPRLLYAAVGPATWLVILAALWRSLRRSRTPTPAADRARALLREHGGPSLAWMGLWEGNTHWFSADGTAYVPYRVIGQVALTTGDPVGPTAHRERHLTEFLDFAERAGLTVAFYSASTDLAERTAARGWQQVQIAEETILDLATLTFTGKKFQDVRTALNQAAKHQVTTRWTTWRSASSDERAQIREISEAWVGEQHLPEMGFTLGGVEELDDPDVRLLLAIDSEDRVHGVASWLPMCGAGQIEGWTLDFMRRRTDGFRSTMELLIGQAARDLHGEGFRWLSLSGAPLADADPGVVDDAERQLVERLLDQLGARLEPVYGFRSLLRFKAKFQPSYRPMHLVYPDAASLPAIGTAVARAYVPEASLGTVWQVAAALRRARG